MTSEAGSGNDLTSRVLAQALSAGIGQSVIVDNRGILAVDAVLNAPADGHTVICYGSPLWLAPFLRANVSYDPMKDLVPVTLATMSPNILVAHPSLPAKSVREMIALAKSRPGELNYATGSAGSSAHLAAELFKSMADAPRDGDDRHRPEIPAALDQASAQGRSEVVLELVGHSNISYRDCPRLRSPKKWSACSAKA